MKTLYYTVEKELQNIDEATGYKNITLYDFIDNKPKIITVIQAENQYGTIDELNHFVRVTLQEEDFETHLDKQSSFIFELL